MACGKGCEVARFLRFVRNEVDGDGVSRMMRRKDSNTQAAERGGAKAALTKPIMDWPTHRPLPTTKLLNARVQNFLIPRPKRLIKAVVASRYPSRWQCGCNPSLAPPWRTARNRRQNLLLGAMGGQPSALFAAHHFSKGPVSLLWDHDEENSVSMLTRAWGSRIVSRYHEARLQSSKILRQQLRSYRARRRGYCLLHQ